MLVPIQYDSDSGHFGFSSFSRLDVILCCLDLQLGKLRGQTGGPVRGAHPPSGIPGSRTTMETALSGPFSAPVGDEAYLCYHCCLTVFPSMEVGQRQKQGFDFDTIPRLVHLDSWISLCYSHIPLVIHSTDGNNLFLTTDSKYLPNQWLGPVSARYDDKLKSRSNYAQLTDVCRDMCASVTEAPFWVLKSRIWPTVEIWKK